MVLDQPPRPGWTAVQPTAESPQRLDLALDGLQGDFLTLGSGPAACRPTRPIPDDLPQHVHVHLSQIQIVDGALQPSGPSRFPLSMLGADVLLLDHVGFHGHVELLPRRRGRQFDLPDTLGCGCLLGQKGRPASIVKNPGAKLAATGDVFM
ncbi:hypothetical protein ACERK3_11180 [Phycisphaerales bacterium AB-hyl4]|uniref:Uncharacterized protein n=1 Tax=Natronomicrosphaera hydrolytica TaxID=3242702 RepID=A0ABV4U7Y1_9BACT